jgi:tol-pal system protein YbgF
MRRTDRFAAARVLGTLAAVLMLGGCATKGDIRDLRSELRDLAVRQDSLLAQLRSQARSTQDTVRRQSNQIVDFRGEISRQLRAISESLTRVEALAGETQRGLVGVRDQLANIRRAPVAAPVGTGLDSTTVMSPGTQEPPAGGGDAQEMFNAGVTQFNRGTLATARTAFEQFLQAYPNHALAPDAHYYLASILVQEGRLDDAEDAFQQILELYPTAGKVPESLYRIGLIQIEQGDTTAAQATLERVTNTYPGTAAAQLATDKLREIR